MKNIIFYLTLHKSHLFFPLFESIRLTLYYKLNFKRPVSAEADAFSSVLQAFKRMSYMAKPKLIKSIPCVILTAFISAETIWLPTLVPSDSPQYLLQSPFFLILSKGELAFLKYLLQMALWLQKADFIY